MATRAATAVPLEPIHPAADRSVDRITSRLPDRTDQAITGPQSSADRHKWAPLFRGRQCLAEQRQIVDRQGIRTLRDPFTNKPNVHFYSTKRVGGAVVDFEAIKLIDFSA